VTSCQLIPSFSKEGKGWASGWVSRRQEQCLEIELFLVVVPDAALIDRAHGNVVCVFGGLHPSPSLLNFNGMKIVSLGGEEHGSTEEGGDDFLPRFRADESDAGNVVGILI